MSSNKFHLNGSTILSLNERFTRMQGHGGGGSGGGGGIQQQTRRVEPFNRSRSRSRSRTQAISQPRATVAPRISLRNRSLLAQLDQRHVLRAALKLKRVCFRHIPSDNYHDDCVVILYHDHYC